MLRDALKSASGLTFLWGAMHLILLLIRPAVSEDTIGRCEIVVHAMDIFVCSQLCIGPCLTCMEIDNVLGGEKQIEADFFA